MNLRMTLNFGSPGSTDELWNYRFVPPHLAYTMWMKFRVLCVHSTTKLHSHSWVILLKTDQFTPKLVSLATLLFLQRAICYSISSLSIANTLPLHISATSIRHCLRVTFQTTGIPELLAPVALLFFKALVPHFKGTNTCMIHVWVCVCTCMRVHVRMCVFSHIRM